MQRLGQQLRNSQWRIWLMPASAVLLLFGHGNGASRGTRVTLSRDYYTLHVSVYMSF